MVTFPPPTPPASTPPGYPSRHKFRVFLMVAILFIFIVMGASMFLQWYVASRVTTQVQETLQEAEDMQRRIEMQVQTELEKNQNGVKQ